MIYGSVCSGIEAATAAWHPLGWRPAFFSEIEPAPRAVLQHRYPAVPLHGDFTTIEAGQYEPIDLLVGGTPCQDFSVAGLRAGLAGERGNLTLEFVRLVDRLRPEWVVWENVPGILSIDGGRALGAFLGGLAQLGYGFAYVVRDAQFFGVPQRRRRIFVVANSRSWRRAAAVLFERESLSGNPPPRRETGQGPSHDIAPSIGASGRGFERAGETRGQDPVVAVAYGGNDTRGPIDIATAVNAHGGPHGRQDFESETFIAHALRADGFDASEDGTGRWTPLVPAIAFDSKASGRNGFGVGEMAPTLRAMGHKHTHQNAGGQIAVAFQSSQSGVRTDDVHATLDSNNGSRRHNGTIAPSGVRRLTPRECERLQGFPDDYTLIPYREKQMADGPRYKMLGNSMAVPVMRWIGERIEMVRDLTADREAA